jgi:hypothetical protein
LLVCRDDGLCAVRRAIPSRYPANVCVNDLSRGLRAFVALFYGLKGLPDVFRPAVGCSAANAPIKPDGEVTGLASADSGQREARQVGNG